MTNFIDFLKSVLVLNNAKVPSRWWVTIKYLSSIHKLSVVLIGVNMVISLEFMFGISVRGRFPIMLYQPSQMCPFKSNYDLCVICKCQLNVLFSSIIIINFFYLYFSYHLSNLT